MNRRLLFGIASFLCLIAAVICFLVALSSQRTPQTGEYSPTTTSSSAVADDPSGTAAVATTTTTAPYISPVNFQALQQENEDIYAWIRIPGTGVDYPVVQNSTDDTFYLDHDSDKQYNVNGAIFSEHQYNSLSFDDSVTVLYGHNMASGEMFGDFQSLYWDRDFLLENDEVVIYLPDRELTFEIFAALPYSRMHLLHYYQMEKKVAFEMFIDDIYSTRKLSAVLIEERKPKYGDQVLVLSTCLSGDNRYRYLVLAVCKNNT